MQNRHERIWEILSDISFIYCGDITTQKAVYDVQFYKQEVLSSLPLPVMKILNLLKWRLLKYSLSNIRDNFVSLHNIQISTVELVDPQLVSQFFDAISITQEQADMISEKTKGQGPRENSIVVCGPNRELKGSLPPPSMKYVTLEKLQIKIIH